MQAQGAVPQRLGRKDAIISELAALSSISALQQAQPCHTTLAFEFGSGQAASEPAPASWPIERLAGLLPVGAVSEWHVDASELQAQEIEAFLRSVSADRVDGDTLSISVLNVDEQWRAATRERLSALGTHGHVTFPAGS